MLSQQFDEICNIKKTAPYGSSKNSDARTAIARIETFQKSDRIRFEGITIDASLRAYADPHIIEYLTLKAEENNSICLISDDNEIVIRLRANLKKLQGGDLQIVHGRELFDSPPIELR